VTIYVERRKRLDEDIGISPGVSCDDR